MCLIRAFAAPTALRVLRVSCDTDHIGGKATRIGDSSSSWRFGRLRDLHSNDVKTLSRRYVAGARQAHTNNPFEIPSMAAYEPLLINAS